MMIYKSGGKGFTLVEVMVSLVIFLIASMGLLPLLLTNIQANQAISLHGKARRIAGQVMAELQLVDYDHLADLSDSMLLADNLEVERQIVRDAPTSGLSRITVTTRWQQKGQSHSYQLQTFRSAP